jgi:hypothetical protein
MQIASPHIRSGACVLAASAAACRFLKSLMSIDQSQPMGAVPDLQLTPRTAKRDATRPRDLDADTLALDIAAGDFGHYVLKELILGAPCSVAEQNSAAW